MVYRAIGLMSGSSLDGLDIAFAEFQEISGKWSFEIKAVACYPYDEDWTKHLRDAQHLGHWITNYYIQLTGIIRVVW